MKSNHRIVLSVAVAAVVSACSTAPERNEALETARVMVPEIEKSQRAGVAAADIANARRSLDAANRLADAKAKKSDMEFEATNAALSARIANEKILTVQANEEVANGTAQRQAVLIQARERDVKASQLRADSLEAQLADLELKKTERGLVLTLGDVLFDTGQATLKPAAYGTLDRLATALREQSGRSVLIEGHTDNVGSDESNQGLSERRARSVQSALAQRGVSGGQLKAVGMGEGSPVESNASVEGRQSNRRVELILSEAPTHIAAD